MVAESATIDICRETATVRDPRHGRYSGKTAYQACWAEEGRETPGTRNLITRGFFSSFLLVDFGIVGCLHGLVLGPVRYLDLCVR